MIKSLIIRGDYTFFSKNLKITHFDFLNYTFPYLGVGSSVVVRNLLYTRALSLLDPKLNILQNL